MPSVSIASVNHLSHNVHHLRHATACRSPSHRRFQSRTPWLSSLPAPRIPRHTKLPVRCQEITGPALPTTLLTSNAPPVPKAAPTEPAKPKRNAATQWPCNTWLGDTNPAHCRLTVWDRSSARDIDRPNSTCKNPSKKAHAEILPETAACPHLSPSHPGLPRQLACPASANLGGCFEADALPVRPE